MCDGKWIASIGKALRCAAYHSKGVKEAAGDELSCECVRDGRNCIEKGSRSARGGQNRGSGCGKIRRRTWPV